MSGTNNFHLIEGPDDYMPSPLNHTPVTFGAEFEFVIATIRPPAELFDPETPDPHPADPRQVRNILSRIEGGFNQRYEAEIRQVQKHLSRTLNDHFGFRHAIAQTTITPEEKADVIDYWLVDHDGSVLVPENNRKEYAYKAVEINSPAYVYEEPAVDAVGSVLTTLVNKYRLHTGPTSSVHVHVGFMQRGYELQELRNIMAIWWVFEEQFFSVVKPHRHFEKWCMKVRSDSRLALMRAVDNSDNPKRAGLDVILAEENLKGLIELFDRGPHIGWAENWATKLAVHTESVIVNKKTVEFRLHEGCLQPEEAARWIDLCCALVIFGSVAKTENLTPWLRAHADNLDDDKNYPIRELLKDMKLDGLAPHFERKAAQMAIEMVEFERLQVEKAKAEREAVEKRAEERAEAKKQEAEKMRLERLARITKSRAEHGLPAVMSPDSKSEGTASESQDPKNEGP